MSNDSDRLLPKGTSKMLRENALSIASLVISLLSLAVAILGVGAAQDQVETAREDVNVALAQLKDSRTGERERLARLVSLEVRSGDSIVVSNAANVPISDISVYLTNIQGKPSVQYNYVATLPACSAVRFEPDQDDIIDDVLITFDDANGGEWSLDRGVDGLTEDRLDASLIPSDYQTWTEAISGPLPACD